MTYADVIQGIFGNESFDQQIGTRQFTPIIADR